MKTQIAHLINGDEKVIRDEKHAKYLTAKPATSHVGIAGTTHEERQKIADKVYEENSAAMHISICDVELVLPIHKSISGKSWSWGTELSKEQYEKICGFPFGVGKYQNMYTLKIEKNCTVWVHVYHRNNERQSWKFGYRYLLDESFVTIL